MPKILSIFQLSVLHILVNKQTKSNVYFTYFFAKWLVPNGRRTPSPRHLASHLRRPSTSPLQNLTQAFPPSVLW